MTNLSPQELNELVEFENDPRFKETLMRMNKITTLEDLSFHLSEFSVASKEEYKFKDLIQQVKALQNRVIAIIQEIEDE